MKKVELSREDFKALAEQAIELVKGYSVAFDKLIACSVMRDPGQIEEATDELYSVALAAHNFLNAPDLEADDKDEEEAG